VQVARNEPTAAQDETGKPMTTETVTLTDLAQQLHSVEKTLAAQPVVDNQRVDSVKQALHDGSYDFSATRVADKFMQFEAQLA
jgi:negative regulator of flagellin synthesis FlgM